MNNEPVAWMELYKGKPNNLAFNSFDIIEELPDWTKVPLFTTPQIKELSDEEIKLIKEVVGDYVCTLKMEIDHQKQAFKGYEHCSNLDGLNNELKDAEQALAILKKASEK